MYENQINCSFYGYSTALIIWFSDHHVETCMARIILRMHSSYHPSLRFLAVVFAVAQQRRGHTLQPSCMSHCQELFNHQARWLTLFVCVVKVIGLSFRPPFFVEKDLLPCP